MTRTPRDLDWFISKAQDFIGKDLECNSLRGEIKRIVIIRSEHCNKLHFILHPVLEFSPNGWIIFAEQMSVYSWNNPTIESVNGGDILICDHNKDGQVEFGSIQVTQQNATPSNTYEPD